jgi:hypothetical protein
VAGGGVAGGAVAGGAVAGGAVTGEVGEPDRTGSGVELFVVVGVAVAEAVGEAVEFGAEVVEEADGAVRLAPEVATAAMVGSWFCWELTLAVAGCLGEAGQVMATTEPTMARATTEPIARRVIRWFRNFNMSIFYQFEGELATKWAFQL